MSGKDSNFKVWKSAEGIFRSKNIIPELSTFADIVKEASNPSLPTQITLDKIRRGIAECVNTGKQTNKAEIKALKRKLMIFRPPTMYLQIDVDFDKEAGNSQQAIDCKTLLSEMTGKGGQGVFCLVGISASGYGVKAFIRATGDGKQFRDKLSVRLEKEGFTGFKIDNLSRSHDCYMPYDKELHVCEDSPVWKLKEQSFEQYWEETHGKEEKRRPAGASAIIDKVFTSSKAFAGMPKIDEDEYIRYALNRAFNFTFSKGALSFDSHEGKRKYSYLCYTYGLHPEDVFTYFVQRAGSIDIPFVEFLRRWGAMNRNANCAFSSHRREVENAMRETKANQRNWASRKDIGG